ncbi:MAG: ATP-binding protein [Gammaproteobacteria bacterium]|jgi:signal transduction histidine kinase|nr:ATP-binding protein [Gammaproteobacteria bacterium]
MNKSNHKRRHSLSAKLLLLFISMAILFVILVGSGIRHAFQEHFKDNIQPHLTQYLEYVKADIGTPPDRARAQELADRMKIEIQISDSNGSWNSSGQLTAIDDLDIERDFTIDGSHFSHVKDKTDNHYLMARDGDNTLLFSIPNVRDQRQGFKRWTPLLILLIILLVLYYATRRLFSPLDVIQAGVQKFGASDIEHRISINRKDELGDLADSFNKMADDIQQMLDAKRQLLLAISHELRSPLTRTRLAAEMLDDGTNKAQIIRDINEMETLIEELMETERLSSRHTKLNKARCDIKTLINDIVQTWHNNAGIIIRLPETAVILDIDTARIKLLLKNLLDNAITHTPEDALPPEISLSLENTHAVVTVTDHGPGIELQHLPKLTEPFYRVDPSRQRETGGYGFGLYLCKMITQAHGGRLEIESKIGTGTRVVVKLPF